MKKKTLIQIIIMVILVIILGVLIKLTINSINPNVSQPNNSSNNVTYSANKEITESAIFKNEKFNSTNVDENAILISGNADVSIKDSEINKIGNSASGDTANFYGINSAILAKAGANLTLKNINVTTNASGANGVFCYGGSATTNNAKSDGTTITISDSTITTSKDNSGGIMTTGGGITNATNLTIDTAGISSAAIRTDRGGGTVNVDKGTYTTTGSGSPVIYSTANVTVSNSDLISKTAEGVIIEGKNSITLNNCNLTDSNTKLNGQSTTYKNIFLYQSMSGDAEDGNSAFTANDCKIITNNGDSFYVTNTTANITLKNNTIINNDNSGNFLRIQKDSWGNSGSNGGSVMLTITEQNVTGNIVVDSISILDMNMISNSYYEGTINGNNSAKSISLQLDNSSKIKLTGDSYVTSIDNSDNFYNNIDFNGYKLYVNGVAIK